MKQIKSQLSINPRVLKEHFATYYSTFLAFCELVDNAIQAKAKNIKIFIEETKSEEVYPYPIKYIEIIDDGHGIHYSEFENKILEAGTTNKDEGLGVGRFSAFQIGQRLAIETIGIDRRSNSWTRTNICIEESIFSSDKKLDQIEVTINTEEVEAQPTYYKVRIDEFYQDQSTKKNYRHKISPSLLPKNIPAALFEKYTSKIFNNDVSFYINDTPIRKEDFIDGQPIKTALTYIDKAGKDQKIYQSCYKIKSTQQGIRIFLSENKGEIEKQVAAFSYDAPWLSPKIGSWFIYYHVDQPWFNLSDQIEFDLDDEAFNFRSFIKDKTGDFFHTKNAAYENFLTTLHSEDFYPYKEKNSTLASKKAIFDKVIYLVEDKYKLSKVKLGFKKLIYSIVDRSLSEADFVEVLDKMLNLDKIFIKRLRDLTESVKMENIIEFTEEVSKKTQELDFLEQIIHGKTKHAIGERKHLHKILEKMLWVFGERFANQTKLLSDKNLENNLRQLRDDLLVYKKDKDKSNFIESSPAFYKDITDLFLYSEKVIDEEHKEVLIVELKAPCVRLSNKEVDQVDRYADRIESSQWYSPNVHYKIFLIGNDLTSQLTNKLKGIPERKNSYNPYFYWENQNKNIQICIAKWSDCITINKRKLNYLSNQLEVKSIEIDNMFETGFTNVDASKYHARLHKTPLAK